MFELLPHVYAEKACDGRYRVFTENDSVVVFVHTQSIPDKKKIASVIRKIAALIGEYHEKVYGSHEEEGGAYEK